MLYLLPILSANMNQPMANDYKVVSVERQEAYAGKLGRRVTQTIVAEKDGVRYEIKLMSHTAIARSTRSYSAGDSIKPDWGTPFKKLD